MEKQKDAELAHSQSLVCNKRRRLPAEVTSNQETVNAAVSKASLQIPELIAALMMTGQHEAIRKRTALRAADSLLFLCSEEDQKLHVVRAGAIPPTLQLLQTGGTKGREISVKLLERLLSEPTARAEIPASLELVKQLVDVLRDSLLALCSRSSAAFILSVLLAQHQSLTKHAVRFGVIHHLLALLKRVEEETSLEANIVKAHVARALAILAATAEICPEMVEMGILGPLDLLLRQQDLETRRRAALLLYNIAAAGSDLKVKVADSGLITSLLALLSSSDLISKVTKSP